MSEQSGRITWRELMSRDVVAAKRFYSQLFGWTDQPFEGGPMPYDVFKLGDLPVGGCMSMDDLPTVADHVPSMWMSYAIVDDLDGSLDRARSAGGTVDCEPMVIAGEGRIACIRDPQDAMFGLFVPDKSYPELEEVPEGMVCWTELMTVQIDKALAFYQQVVGWQVQTMEMGKGRTYYLLQRPDGRLAGGAMATPVEAGDLPPMWMVYFNVNDVDAMTDKAGRLGAVVHQLPTDIPTIGRFSVIGAPDSSIIGLFKKA